MATTLETPVLIVGAGPAGLVTSIALSRSGVASLLVEKHTGTSIVPRATGISTRSMEIFRQWGLDDAIRAAAFEAEVAMSIRPHLTAPPIAVVPLGFPTRDEALAVSPTWPAVCAQDYLEPILLDHAHRLGRTDFRFSTELVSLEQADDQITALTRDRRSGNESVVRARYVVGCDGTRSTVRTSAGIGLQNLSDWGAWQVVIFRADLAQHVEQPLHVIYGIAGAPAETVMLPTEAGDRWILGMKREPGVAAGEMTDAEVRDVIRRSTGLPELAVDVVAKQTFGMAAAVADSFRLGRVFLAGDAAHRITPSGGTGMNTAIADGHNLAWKLAAVINGWAGESLLATYDVERHPVGERNARRSVGEEPERVPDGLDIDLAYRYASSAILSDGLAPAEIPGLHLDGRPGTRAPHFWLRRGNERISSLDLLGHGLTLLTGPRGHAWHKAAEYISVNHHVPIEPQVIGGHGLEPERDDWLDLLGVSADGAILVRPDGFIAWRGASLVNTPSQELIDIVRRLFGQLALVR